MGAAVQIELPEKMVALSIKTGCLTSKGKNLNVGNMNIEHSDSKTNLEEPDTKQDEVLGMPYAMCLTYIF